MNPQPKATVWESGALRLTEWEFFSCRERLDIAEDQSPAEDKKC